MVEETEIYTNNERMKTISGRYPAGSSLKVWDHMLQNYNSGAFHEYDNGKEQNLKLYV